MPGTLLSPVSWVRIDSVTWIRYLCVKKHIPLIATFLYSRVGVQDRIEDSFAIVNLSRSQQTAHAGASTVAPPLSDAQQRAVEHRGSDLQLIACAGSGKTETVAQRVAGLIDEGVSPDAIVAFTFTDRAALELKDRILRRVKERKGAAFLDRLGPMYVGTIHGYCFRLLQ